MTTRSNMIDVYNKMVITEDMRVVKFEEDKDGKRKGLVVNLPSASYMDNGIEFKLCSMEAVEFMLSELFKGVHIMQEDLATPLYKQLIALSKEHLELKKLTNDTFKLLRRTVADAEKYRKETEKVHKQNKEYQEWYGKYINPTQIIEELYNGGRVGQGGLLITKENWKSGVLKRNTSGVRFWLSFMHEHKIFILQAKNVRIALVSRDNALKILNNKRIAK